MILQYDTQKVKDLYTYILIRSDKRCFNSLERSKITRYILILAIQGIASKDTVMKTVFFWNPE
jgi:hypothetical protein